MPYMTVKEIQEMHISMIGYETKNDSLEAENRALREALESIAALCDEEMGEWKSKAYGQLPVRFANFFHIREASESALERAGGERPE